MCLLAPFVINFLGGSEFVESIIVLRILIGGVVLFYMTQPISWLVVTLGGQKWLPWVYLVSSVFNVVGNVFLIPKYSFLAAAILTWASELIILVLLIIVARKVWKQKYA